MKKSGHIFKTAIVASLIYLNGCAAADDVGMEPGRVLFNGRIMTVSGNMDWVEAIAIKDGRILATGSSDEVLKLVSNTTQIQDLNGQFVMPGFIDVHNHAFFAGEEKLYGCPVNGGMSFVQLLETVADCADQLQEGEWITGGPWGIGIKSVLSQSKSLAAIDNATKGRPMVLRDDSGHNALVNSAALAIIGFDESTPNPDKGEIFHDPETGKLTGLLFESAARVAHKAAPARSIEDDAKAVKFSIEVLSRNGVTSFLDAAVPPRIAQAYSYLDKKEGLNARAALAMSEGVLSIYADETLEEIVDMRSQFKSENVLPDYVKFYLDGIPPTHTANLLTPYLPSKKFGDSFYGPLYYSKDELARLVTRFDNQGVTIKLHATGEGSVRAAFDAIEAARKINGDSGLKHHIAHAGHVHSADRERFATLKVSLDASPTFWYPQITIDAIGWAIGEKRAEEYWPFREVIDKGGMGALGSDWPVLPFVNPLRGVESMVTRRDPETDATEPLWADQAIDLEEAIRAATINSAVTLNIQNETGSLEVGKSADLIIFDLNPFEIDPIKISELELQETIYRGKTIHKK